MNELSKTGEVVDMAFKTSAYWRERAKILRADSIYWQCEAAYAAQSAVEQRERAEACDEQAKKMEAERIR